MRTLFQTKKITLGKRYDDAFTGQAYLAYWDWIRVRLHAPAEPTLSLGGEEYASQGFFNYPVRSP